MTWAHNYAPIVRAISLPDPARSVVLVTRPEPGAHETVQRLAAMGLTGLAAPMTDIVPLPANLPAPDTVAAILVTSRNGLTGIPPAYHRLPLWAVGAATAERARNQGFIDVHSADGDAMALADRVIEALSPAQGTLLLTTGRGHGLSLCQKLRSHGFRVARRVIYRSRRAKSLDETVESALRYGQIGTVLFFSAGTARNFVRLLRISGLEKTASICEAMAISQAVAMALEPLAWRRIRVAAKPNQDALLALLR
ncbi:MAG: uroporphyrinogen-III synthase [Acetobacteraceae bacterium]